jgi:glutamyl-tRNA(Gln) amidotransferase subunit D
MYNKKISNLLKKLKVSIGDKIQINHPNFSYTGILLEGQSENESDNTLIIKLDSGYNIGVNIEGASIIKLSSKSEKILEGSSISSKNLVETNFKDSICLLSTGGTILSKVDYLTGGVSPQISVQEIFKSYLGIEKIAKISLKNLFNLLSENLSQNEWEAIAQEVKNIFDDGAEGVVILHGTDTMGYTAAALSYALCNLGKPVILTGSQRSIDRPSSDAKQNLFCSLAAAKENIAGVFVCSHATINDDFNYLHLGTRVRKSHTTIRWTFKSIGVEPVAKIYFPNLNVEFNNLININKKNSNQKIELKNKFSSNVHFAWAYPGLKPEEIRRWAKYDGVLIAGTGMGHIPVYSHVEKIHKKVIKELKDLVESNVLLVMASQTGAGRVMLQTYSTGRLLSDIGIIGDGCDWLAETAFVKLCWALGQTSDPKKAKEILLTPINYDITPFSIIQTNQEEE